MLFLITVSTAFAANNYILTNSVIITDNVSPPEKGGSYTDTTTGATWTRRSELTELTALDPTNSSAMIVYSRYSPTNSNGQYLLVHGTNSTSCFVYRLSDNTVVANLRRDSTHQIGEVNEIRWDYTGNYPNRVYFVYGMSFYYMDVITSNGSPTLIRDFSSDFPSGVQIMNDVEGDSSSNSRYWAWLVLGGYDGSIFPVIKIFTYDKQTNTIMGTLSVGDVTQTHYDAYYDNKLPRPNMVEISPDGTKVMINSTRAYYNSGNPSRTWAFEGTALDAPTVWDLDLDPSSAIRVGWDEDHSGWAFLSDGTQVFVSKDGGRDKMQYCRTDGTGGAYPGNCVDFLDYSVGGYYGYHMARMPASKPGWILMSTVGGSGWPEDQLVMCELKSIAQSPRQWQISPQYNEWDSDDGYRSEGSAAISQDGNKIYVSGNWKNTTTGHQEAYEIDITGWGGHFGIGEVGKRYRAVRLE